jgi:dihydroanticapsin dehydrogenase
MRGLPGKVALVTGGLGLLGYASAGRLAEEGCKVAIWDLGEDAGNKAGAIGCVYYPVDITREDQVKTAAAAVKRDLGPVDVLVNCAALFVFKGVEATPEDWEKILRVNVIGTSLVTRHVVPQMKERRGGSIINFSSVSGIVGQPGHATYNATKFAIRGLTKCWAQDLGPDKIRVNSICPAYMEAGVPVKPDAQPAADMQEKERRIAALHLLNRRGRPDEIAGAVAFLASEDSTFITGSDLVVDGGYLAR